MITACDVNNNNEKLIKQSSSNKITSKSNGSLESTSIMNNIKSTSSIYKQDVIIDQNVPSELSFQYVCDDAHSQRYLCQLRMSKRNAFKSHYLDDQENDDVTKSQHQVISNKTSDFSLYHQSDDMIKPIMKIPTEQSYGVANNCYYTNNGGAIKRGCDDVDAENEDDNVTSFSSSSMSSGRRSPPKKPKFIVTYKEMREFFALLNEESIREFLKRDTCCLISDKYALAMVFTYFKRAKFYLNEYTRINFYLALYLASDIEEDVDEYKYEIFPWALGGRWRTKFSGFLKKRDALLRRIGYRAIVSRKCCEEVMGLVPDHYAWKRERSEDHGGATRAYAINRCRRMHSEATKIDEEELNLPRGPYENPRPCSICLFNKYGKKLKSTPISQYIPVMNHNDRNACTTNENIDKTIFVTQQHTSKSEQDIVSVSTTTVTTITKPKKILKQSQITNINIVDSNIEQQPKASSKVVLQHENDENYHEISSTTDINNNNITTNQKNAPKINNLVLSENSFIYKNTSYQHMLSNEHHKSTSTSTSTESNLDRKFSTNLFHHTDDTSDEEDEEDHDDDLTDDCEEEDDNDDVFAYGSKHLSHHLHHHTLKTKHNLMLNNKKTCHPKKWASNTATMNDVSNNKVSNKKRMNFSLSATAALAIASGQTTISNTNGSNEPSKGDLLFSTSYPKLTNLLNDQLVPRELLVNLKT